MSPDVTETEKFVLIELLEQEIDRPRLPLSPRIVTLRRILDKLDPQPARKPLRYRGYMHRCERRRDKGEGADDEHDRTSKGFRGSPIARRLAGRVS